MMRQMEKDERELAALRADLSVARGNIRRLEQDVRIERETNASLRAENARLREALEEFLDDSGYSHMTDNELNFEIEQGNGRAPIILRARAALARVG